MKTIKPIETRYAGCRFRSRTEARWAVFFDECGIDWEYEKEGFDLSDIAWHYYGIEMGRYLPDFFLPELKTWVEIKGTLPPNHFQQTEEELAIEMVVRATKAWTGMVIFGTPGPEVPTFVFGPSDWMNLGGDGILFNGRRIIQPWTHLEYVTFRLHGGQYKHFDKAVQSAMAARFEFGEKGFPR